MNVCIYDFNATLLYFLWKQIVRDGPIAITSFFLIGRLLLHYFFIIGLIIITLFCSFCVLFNRQSCPMSVSSPYRH